MRGEMDLLEVGSVSNATTGKSEAHKARPLKQERQSIELDRP
jgi:hypothetical protein